MSNPDATVPMPVAILEVQSVPFVELAYTTSVPSCQNTQNRPPYAKALRCGDALVAVIADDVPTIVGSILVRPEGKVTRTAFPCNPATEKLPTEALPAAASLQSSSTRRPQSATASVGPIANLSSGVETGVNGKLFPKSIVVVPFDPTESTGKVAHARGRTDPTVWFTSAVIFGGP